MGLAKFVRMLVLLKLSVFTRPMAPTTYADVLARNIRAARNRADIGQASVATRMRNLGFPGWHPQTVSSSEKGKRRTTAEEILGLALALETTVQRLMTPLGEDKWVELPSGQSLNVEAVVHLVAGTNDGVLRWHGDTPYRTGAALAALAVEASWPEESDAAGRRPVAAAIVVSDRGVLVGKRTDGTPPWTFIAGEVEPGETSADAVIREVKEETGCLVRFSGIIGKRVHPATGRTMIYVSAAPTHGTDVFVGDEAELAEVRWVGLAEADELLPGMFEPVREYLSRELGR